MESYLQEMHEILFHVYSEKMYEKILERYAFSDRVSEEMEGQLSRYDVYADDYPRRPQKRIFSLRGREHILEKIEKKDRSECGTVELVMECQCTEHPPIVQEGKTIFPDPIVLLFDKDGGRTNQMLRASYHEAVHLLSLSGYEEEVIDGKSYLLHYSGLRKFRLELNGKEKIWEVTEENPSFWQPINEKITNIIGAYYYRDLERAYSTGREEMQSMVRWLGLKDEEEVIDLLLPLYFTHDRETFMKRINDQTGGNPEWGIFS